MNDAAEPSRPAEGDARTQTDAPCPICAEPVRLSADTFPFCSQRCRLVDLGRWLDGKYRISRPSRDDAAES